MEIKTLDEEGLDFLIKEEGVRLKPYLDSVGIPTIGVGSTYYESGKRVKMTDPPITHKRAMELFANIVKPYEILVWSVTRDDINQNQFNALVSLAFNIGQGGFKKSSVLKKVNSRFSEEEIRQSWLLWKFAGNKPILLKRRIREFSLYSAPIVKQLSNN